MLTASTRLALVALLALVVAGAAAGPASAHAILVTSVPASGGSLPDGQAPVLRFSEPVVPASSRLEVVTADGKVLPLVPLGHEGADARTLTVARSVVTSAVPQAGAATLRWSVLAEDGHRGSGDLAFTLPPALVPTPPTLAPVSVDVAPAPPDSRLVDRVFTASRSAGYLAMTVLCGGLAFLALAWPEGAAVTRVRRLLWTAWALGVVTSLAGVGLQAAYAGRLGLGSAFRASVVIPGFDTRVGMAWASRGLLFVLAIPVLAALQGGSDRIRSTGWRVGAAAVALGLLRTPGLVAHSSEGRMAWLGSIADMAHLVGVAVWLGGLVLLCAVVLPRRRPDELRRVVPRFSTLAGAAIAVIVVAGSVLSWQLVGSFGALTSTRFGHVLLLKLVLVAGIGGAALFSHRWSAGRLDLALARAEPAGATIRPFVISVATEVTLAVAVLTVASVLVATSPGR